MTRIQAITMSGFILFLFIGGKCAYAQKAVLEKYQSQKTTNIKTMNEQTAVTEKIMKQFNDAFQQHDPSLLDNIISYACVMESIQGPEGVRYEGFEACSEFWRALANDSQTHFDLEEVFVAGDRATIRWRYYWGVGKEHAVRGVNLMRVADGKIVEALGYSKTVPTTGLDR